MCRQDSEVNLCELGWVDRRQRGYADCGHLGAEPWKGFLCTPARAAQALQLHTLGGCRLVQAKAELVLSTSDSPGSWDKASMEAEE